MGSPERPCPRKIVELRSGVNRRCHAVYDGFDFSPASTNSEEIMGSNELEQRDSHKGDFERSEKIALVF